MTTTARHTPGPWRYCGEQRADVKPCQCRQIWSIPEDVPVFTARAERMAQIGLAHHKWGDGPELIYGEIPLGETEANARLIAAAPELLEVAREAARCHVCRCGPYVSPCLKCQAEAAIAKAEGRQP